MLLVGVPKMDMGAGLFGLSSTELKNPTSDVTSPSPLYHLRPLTGKSRRISLIRSSYSGGDIASEEILKIFLKERQVNGDLVSKVSDRLWRGNDFFGPETGILGENKEIDEVAENEDSGGFLKLVQKQDWISGGTIAPVNKKVALKNRENDSEKRKRLNLLKYDALKRELLLMTTGVGAACTLYCLLTLSVQASASYAVGVAFSCLYLQLLYRHTDNVSKEAIPLIFLQKKSKKIGIRSEDLKILFERTARGSALALSSPRLVLPAAIYGIWGLTHHFLGDLFDFQLVPAMFGLFAYKAAALIQVYRDNEDLKFIFSEDEASA